VVVERLLERERMNNNGNYPETIALVLWGTDNIKTYGESLAQVRAAHAWGVGGRGGVCAQGPVGRLQHTCLMAIALGHVVELEVVSQARTQTYVRAHTHTHTHTQIHTHARAHPR